MVNKGRVLWSIVSVSAILLCGVAIWAIVPRLAVTKGEPYGMMIRDALGAYYDIHGRFPPTLLGIEPFIDGNVGIECVIQQVQEKRYLVTIQSTSNGDHFVEVVYAVEADGTLEDYDVRILDSIPDK